MYWLTMRLLPDDQRGEWVRAMRARARRDAEVLTPRPGQPIYGLAAPALTPAAVTQYQLSDEKWIAVTLTYGQPDAPEGPCVVVTTVLTEAAPPGSTSGDGLEAELRQVVGSERDRVARRAGAAEPGTAARLVGSRETGTAAPLVVSRETLPAGRSLVGRSGSVWAARLLPADPPADGVVVTIVGLGVSPESVRLQPIADLRPMIEAELERIIAMVGRGAGKPRSPRPEPDVELEPAEGSRRSGRWPSSRSHRMRTGARGCRPGSGNGTTPTGGGCIRRSGSGRSASINGCAGPPAGPPTTQ